MLAAETCKNRLVLQDVANGTISALALDNLIYL